MGDLGKGVPEVVLFTQLLYAEEALIIPCRVELCAPVGQDTPDFAPPDVLQDMVFIIVSDSGYNGRLHT